MSIGDNISLIKLLSDAADQSSPGPAECPDIPSHLRPSFPSDWDSQDLNSKGNYLLTRVKKEKADATPEEYKKAKHMCKMLMTTSGSATTTTASEGAPSPLTRLDPQHLDLTLTQVTDINPLTRLPDYPFRTPGAPDKH
jgi:hypothetical protein